LERLRGKIFTRDYLPLVQPFPQVRALFERIKADGKRIALASSAKGEEIEAHKKKLQIESLVDAITSADDVERSKPKPDIFEAALAKLGDVRGDEVVVVGDTPYDAQAARKAEIATIGVLSGGFSVETLRAEGVIGIYRDAADLLALYASSPWRLGTA
jgi:phosphoglycolate phosphatase-like HAD superfamily hydrolase